MSGSSEWRRTLCRFLEAGSRPGTSVSPCVRLTAPRIALPKSLRTSLTFPPPGRISKMTRTTLSSGVLTVGMATSSIETAFCCYVQRPCDVFVTKRATPALSIMKLTDTALPTDDCWSVMTPFYLPRSRWLKPSADTGSAFKRTGKRLPNPFQRASSYQRGVSTLRWFCSYSCWSWASWACRSGLDMGSRLLLPSRRLQATASVAAFGKVALVVLKSRSQYSPYW